jgi:hypothetical protein
MTPAPHDPTQGNHAQRPGRSASTNAGLLRWLILGLMAVVLVACGTQPAPPDDDDDPTPALRIDTITAGANARTYVLQGANIRGDATVFVCDVVSPIVVVFDATDAQTPDTSRTGVRVQFRVPNLGADPRTCDVRVEQELDGETESVTLVAALAYTQWDALAGARVLVYASIFSGSGEENPRARFLTAVTTVEAEQELDVTVANGTPEEFRVGLVAQNFLDLLDSETWDAVVFIEERWSVDTDVLDAVSTYLTDGGRVLAAYWATFENGEFDAPAGTFGEPARAFASAFGLTVTPDDNVTPVEGGTVPIAFGNPLDAGLAEDAYTLFNDDFYVYSYAQRLTPDVTSTSLCSYLDEDEGSCAVANEDGTGLYLGFTLAPLAVAMTGQDLETFFENTLRYVVVEADD